MVAVFQLWNSFIELELSFKMWLFTKHIFYVFHRGDHDDFFRVKRSDDLNINKKYFVVRKEFCELTLWETKTTQ